MSTTLNSIERGVILCERLGLPIVGREGHDAKCACIACDSSDGFRVHSDSGVAYCYVCQARFSRLELATTLLRDESAAWKLLEEIGLEQPRANGHHCSNGNGSAPANVLEIVARQKRVTPEALAAFGATVEGNAVTTPMYDRDGLRCSTFRLTTKGDKGMNEKGKPSGAFFPHNAGAVRLPKPGETWQQVEGVKDAAALHTLELLACGLPGSAMSAKFARLFRQVNVVIIPDRDTAGIEGASKTAARLYGVAASVRIAALPAEVVEKSGADVRDILRQPNGREAVLQAIADAPEWSPPATAENANPEAVHFTDVGNGKLFAEDHGADVRYCHPRRKWYAYNGKFWALDERGEIMAKAKATIGAMFTKAAELEGGARARLVEHALESEQIARLNAMITAAQSESKIPVVPDQMECDPWLLNTLSGTINLRTGICRPHSRADLITRIAPVEYATNPGDDCPIWEGFIYEILGEQPELISFVKRLLGYCLTGDVREQIVPIFWGAGSNGKSTLLETMLFILGEYALKAPRGLLDQKRGETHPTELVSLFRKRLVALNETDDGRRMAEAQVKEISGGDQITARGMREDFWTFPATHKVILATNHRPAIKGTDHAIWRRIRLVPFTVTIPDERQDKTLPKKLQAEAPAILRWLVAGCLEWQRHGLGLPEQVKMATDEYRADEDVLGGFISNCCVVDSHTNCPATQLFEAYREFTGDREITQTAFGLRLAQRGFHSDRYTAGKNRGRKGWWGIGLQASSEQSE